MKTRFYLYLVLLMIKWPFEGLWRWVRGKR
jgi:hypothetical protein